MVSIDPKRLKLPSTVASLNESLYMVPFVRWNVTLLLNCALAKEEAPIRAFL